MMRATTARQCHLPFTWLLVTYTNQCRAKAGDYHEKLLAVVWADFYLRPHIELSRLITRTDYDGLKWLLTSADDSRKLDGLWLRLLQFDFKVVTGAGNKRQAPYALPRLMTGGMDKTRQNEVLPVLIINGTEEKGDLETKCFEESRSCKKQSDSPMYNNGE